MGSSGCVGCGTGRARRSTRGGLIRGGWSGVHARLAAGRRQRCQLRSCWRPFATILARSSSQGEGHRKVHARLWILDGVRVARTRVLRVMRAQGLISPHRGRQGDPKAHDGTIVTSEPCVMWGTDGVRVFTSQDGWVWTIAAVDRWNAECVCWHVCKVGSRFAALEHGRSRARATLRLGRRGRGPRAGAADGPRQPVSVAPLPQPAPLLRHPLQFRLPHRTGNQRGRRALESQREGAGDLRPGL